MVEVGAFPSLRNGAVQEGVGLVGENALNVARLAVAVVVEDRVEGFLAVDLYLAILPARDFDDEVDDIFVRFVCVERYIVPEGDGMAILLEPDTPVLRGESLAGMIAPEGTETHQSVASANSPQAKGVVVKGRVDAAALESSGGREGGQHSPGEAHADHGERM